MNLHNSGFDTEPFGNRTIAVKAAPAAVGQGDLERVIFEILEIAERTNCAAFRWRSAARHRGLHRLPRGDQDQYAARSAQDGVDAAQLAATEYPMACPHGRPVALQYGMREILRAFHRI
jgi:DNA mismatch repair protein MutL